MNIGEVKECLVNKINRLTAERQAAFEVGDLDRVTKLDVAIAETQLTVDQLNTINA